MTKLEDAILDYFNINKEAHDSFANVERQIDGGKLDDVLGYSVGHHHLRQIMWFRAKKIDKFKKQVKPVEKSHKITDQIFVHIREQLNEATGALDDNGYASNSRATNEFVKNNFRPELFSSFQDSRDNSADDLKEKDFTRRGGSCYWLKPAYIYKPAHWSRIYSLKPIDKIALNSLFGWKRTKDLFDLNQKMRDWLGIPNNPENDNTGRKVSDSAALFNKCIERLLIIDGLTGKPKDYSVEMLSNFIYWNKDRYVAEKRKCECKNLLEKFKNVVLHGAPGTGKTYMAKQIAAELIGCPFEKLSNNPQFGFVQFHPSYDYTDFVEGLRPEGESAWGCSQTFRPVTVASGGVEGLRPVTDASGGVGFRLEPGTFKKFCDTAREAWEAGEKEKNYVFVIDEINRGDISKIFGELFFSIDPGYRGEDGSVSTQYSNLHDKDEKKFYVPENVYVIGTMNDIDRSVDSFDYAMRRRFKFVEIKPDDTAEEILGEPEDPRRRAMTGINKLIKRDLGSQFQLGADYFNDDKDKKEDAKDKKEDAKDKKDLWRHSIRPLICEYLRGAGKDDEKLIQDYAAVYVAAVRGYDLQKENPADQIKEELKKELKEKWGEDSSCVDWGRVRDCLKQPVPEGPDKESIGDGIDDGTSGTKEAAGD